jgi:hypothetical protein
MDGHARQKKEPQQFSSGWPFVVSGVLLLYWQQTPRAGLIKSLAQAGLPGLPA